MAEKTEQQRRRHTRHELRHDALLVVQGGGPTACQVANVCERGMWLEGVAADSVIERLSRDPTLPVEIHLFIGGDDGERHERHMARVRRIRSPGIGVQLEQPAPDLMGALRSPGVAHRRLLMDPQENARLWRVFREQVPTLFSPLLEHFVEASLRLINQALEKTATLNERNQLRDARLLLIDERNALMRRFMQAWWEQSALSPAHGGGESARLALVDKNLFEDWLELQMVASSVASRYPEVLFRLNQLLSQLSESEYHDRNNPLAPVALCQALQYSMTRDGYEAAAKPLLNQAFEEALEACWSPAMHKLESAMIAQGLRVLRLEEMPVRWRTEPVPPRSLRVNEDAPPSGSAGETEGGRAAGTRGHGTVLRLIRLQRDPQSPEPQVRSESASAIIAAVHDELLAALEHSGGNLEAALSRGLEADPASADQLTPAHWDQVRLVDRIFAAMDQLEHLPHNLRALLDRLRVPVLQLVLNDPDFLDDPDHTARGLLNQLMQLCVADRGSTRHLSETVNSVVERLTAHPVPCAETLESVAAELSQMVQRQKQAFLRNADRIARNHQGRQQLERARCAIQRRIRASLAGHEVPMILLDLLTAGWEQSLVMALLREGAESEAVTERFEVILQIQAWLGRDSQRAGSGLERELETPALLDFLERELASSGEPGRYQGVLRRLGAQLREEERPDFVWLASYPLGEAPEPEEPQEPSAPDAGRWRTRACEMTVGDWVELVDEKGDNRRVRLVWVGDDAYRFVFLTPEGLHELEYGFSEMVEGLAEGRIQPVEAEDVAFVDQSLYTIVQDLYREMAFRATHDPLTGCFIRHEFEKHLGRLARQAGAAEAAATLLVVDVDQFSVINASYGTRAGDAVLRELGALLEEEAALQGAESAVGRLGSNEFAIALQPMAMESGLDLGERLRRRVADHGFRSQGVGFGASVSVGVALFDGTSTDPDALLNAAGLAVEVARRAGGNNTRFAGEHEQERRRHVLGWIPRIDRALQDGTLTLRGQRIMPLRGEGSESIEVLLGVRDDQGQSVSPQPFMEAAEESRRVARVDRWVVERTLEWMADHPEQVAGLGGVNINLSGASMNDDGFLVSLEQRLRETTVALDRICFEVTETAAVANLHYTADFMRSVRHLGCRFALDDFGTGLSSYAYLQQLPVDALKMDGVFIRDLNQELTHYAMVRSINELAHFLGLSTIAEFVEDLETLETLKEIGVDYAQGYGIARPRSLDLRQP